MRTGTSDQTAESPGGAKRVAKKDQILALYQNGITEVADLAAITQSRPSYVASVLQQARHLSSYFDLYTSTGQPMNVYSKHFAGKLGFKDEETSRRSVELIDRLHGQFELAGDRAGQHHALLMALLMFDRARWSGKRREAEVFRRWLAGQLEREGPAEEPPFPAQQQGPDEEAGAGLDRRPAPPGAPADAGNLDKGGVVH